MKYFKLYPTVKFVNSNKNSCLYDFTNGLMIKLDNKNSSALNKCHNQNEPISSTTDSLVFFDKLEELGLGYYTNKLLFTEDFETINANLKTDILPQNNFIQRAFIELGSDCNFDCIFCERDTKLYRKTGCKKWENYEKKVNLTNWDEILNQLSKLKCKELNFIGGNPLLRIDSIINIINISKNYNFENFTIYTNGTLLDNYTINFLKNNNITLNIQILSFNPKTLNQITSNKLKVEELHKNLITLKNENINIVAQILINKYNQNEIEIIKDKLLKEYNIKNIKIDYIYNKPKNNHYSEKYINNMYNKHFGTVTINKFNFLQTWNSCLKGQILIREDGNISVCPMIRDSIGNVLEEKIYNLLKKEKYSKYTKITKKSINTCVDCSYQYNCLECRAIEISATNNLYGLEFCSYKE